MRKPQERTSPCSQRVHSVRFWVTVLLTLSLFRFGASEADTLHERCQVNTRPYAELIHTSYRGCL
ncbi:MAG: hypothetical protein M2R45_04633 [Verrucomicrobia subdivision 3 bacterium]|nr:hypothetical protein [Limisphaerales bacterium]MCS1417125.1 hypothetical protein [Limisphaerales bacterium]